MAETDRLTRVREKVALLPDSPGVYQFLDARGGVIYVGKAKNLKKRVSTYFLSGAAHAPKIRVMVRKIEDLRHIVVGSESEALLLENNMIKSLQPRYNTLLKDDKTYPWVAIRNEPFPRVVSTRRFQRDGSRYFGPYASTFVQKSVLETIRGLYMLRTCSLNLTPEMIARRKYGVCLEYHIGNCKGPCAGHQAEGDYNDSVALAASLLGGDVRATRDYLQRQMEKAAAELRYEEAARFKRRMDILTLYQSRSVVVSNTLTDLDVFSLLIDGGEAFCNFMRIVHGAVVNSLTVELTPGVEDEPRDILSHAVGGIRERLAVPLSREVIVPFPPDGALFPGVRFTVPRRGEKKQLLELSERNCRVFRLEKLKQMEIRDPARHTERILAVLQKELRLKELPRHIECFDNSNLQGTHPVASCVVFRDAKPSRKEYRHFNIKTVVGANDFASMEEVVTRRYSRLLEEGGELPGLIVVDGGKGQLGFACEVLHRLGIGRQVPIVGLAKRIEEVYFPHDPDPYYLDRNSEALKLLIRIRDEAHRFGVAFHRQKRSLAFIRSELECIPALGKRSVEKLLGRFRTVSRIRKASEEELAAVIGARRAAGVADYFRKTYSGTRDSFLSGTE